MMKMNEKVKKMAFSMAGTLVAALVLCAVIIPTAYRSYAMMGVTVLWSAVLYLRIQRNKKQQPKHHTMQTIDLEPDYKRLFTQQIQLRTQEKLRSKFPGATFDLCDTEIEQIAAMGKAVYVPIKKADDYCHMSISMKNNGDIQLTLFSLVNLDNIRQDAIKQLTDVNHQPDVEQWYTQKGQQLLTELITNMNSRGYTKLYINEAGDVTVKENGRSVLKDRFSEIPPKEQWGRLKELMAEDEVDVQVSPRRLTVAW